MPCENQAEMVMTDEEAGIVTRPSMRIVWFARVMGLLCWIGIAGALVFGLMGVFDAFPPGWNARESHETTLIGSTLVINDPAHPNATAELREDLLFRLSRLISIALFVWALLSAHRIFAGIGRGEYFARGTILGLRNFALAVLLDMTLAPIATTLASAAYMSRFEHGEFTLQLALNGSIMLMLIFSGAVALISTVMARAAAIAEENRQFV
jgi:hypothetical protein